MRRYRFTRFLCPAACDEAPAQTAKSTASPNLQNVNDVYQRGLRRADRIAIALAALVGSWAFIVGQTVFLGLWVALNIIGWQRRWDPYPFILMNLVLSLLGAYTAPLIMMAQNRDAERDRLMMEEDFATNRRAAEQISKILVVLDEHGDRLAALCEQQATTASRREPV